MAKKDAEWTCSACGEDSKADDWLKGLDWEDDWTITLQCPVCGGWEYYSYTHHEHAKQKHKKD